MGMGVDEGRACPPDFARRVGHQVVLPGLWIAISEGSSGGSVSPVWLTARGVASMGTPRPVSVDASHLAKPPAAIDDCAEAASLRDACGPTARSGRQAALDRMSRPQGGNSARWPRLTETGGVYKPPWGAPRASEHPGPRANVAERRERGHERSTPMGGLKIAPPRTERSEESGDQAPHLRIPTAGALQPRKRPLTLFNHESDRSRSSTTKARSRPSTQKGDR